MSLGDRVANGDGREIGRYFGIDQREIGDWAHGEFVVESRLAVAPRFCRPDGGMRAAALMTAIDNVGGFCSGLASLPDGWVVTTNLSARTARIHQVGPVCLVARVLRAGRNAVVASVSARDEGADDAVVAEGVLTSAVLIPEGGPPQWSRPAEIRSDPEPGFPPIPEWLGVQPVDAAAVECAIADTIRNPWGILHGGVVAALVDLASEHAVQTATDAPAATADATLHFLAPGRVGPVRASAEVVGARPDGRVCRVEVRDRGADDRLVAVAVTTVREV